MALKEQELFDLEHLDVLYAYALLLTRDRTFAEDLVQETYLRAIKGFLKLKPSSNLRAWLLSIMRNIWLNELRRRQRSREVADLDLDQIYMLSSQQESHDQYKSFVIKRECELVRNAIEQLPADAREIIWLREYEELSYQEISTLLNCPPGTVMSRIARARAKLRDLLSDAIRPQTKIARPRR